jgi:hypothetical protein
MNTDLRPIAGTPVFGLAGTYHEEVAKELGLPFTAELYGEPPAIEVPLMD